MEPIITAKIILNTLMGMGGILGILMALWYIIKGLRETYKELKDKPK